MSVPPAILAAGDDSSVKLVIGAIVFVGWIVAQVYNAIAKTPEKHLPPSRPKAERTPPAPRRQSPGPVVPPMPQRTRPQPPCMKRTLPTQATPAPYRPPAEPYRPPLEPPRAAPARVAVAPPMPAAAKPAGQQRVLRTLLQPRNLKKAFVLNELLQPPVALRSTDEGPTRA